MLKVKLKVASGRHQGQVIPLTTRKFLIGREHDCQLRTNSDLVSRHHCVFTVDDYALRLRDLGSTNGTLVNGERIREVVLQAGDRVQIGKLSFEILVSEKQVAEQSVAPTVAIDGAAAEPMTTERATVSLSAEETQLELETRPASSTRTETEHELPVPGAAAGAGDTTIQQPVGEQAVLAYPPGYAPPVGMYPQWPYGAPNQYYAGPYGYPPPGYPPQGPYPGYPQPYPSPPTPQPSGPGPKGQAVMVPPVRLPAPEVTGAVDAPRPAEKPKDEPKEPGAQTPSERAAEIIKQRTRRSSS